MAITISQHSEFSQILRDDEQYAVEGDGSFGNRLNTWFDELMLQSGLGITPGMVLALSLCSAVAVGGLAFVYQENLLTTAFGGMVGFLIPTLFAMVWRSRRQGQISQQMPPMIDELARAAKTGRSLENCLSLVAGDTPNPLGAELRNCTRKLSLGLNVDEALRELPKRTGLISTSVLATALSVHRQTGGDLVAVLERLSQTLRDRLQFQGRLRAATAASRATATLMILLPMVILLFFVFRDGNYLNELLASTWGRWTTIAAFVLEFVGAIWVVRILQKSRQL
ncbi:MAG: type II secretion system F family protein [Planctomycetaceae bacterium]|nr:type II secretion system F family protein [Planctomycetaceae bacterium]